jgi:5-methylcytosine-specific restriction endonuclease McrA
MGSTRRTRIPSAQRRDVATRDGYRCPRCGCSTLAAGETHHRRSRRVQDSHTHCLCNLLRLCSTCHRDVTVHVEQAMADGWVVSAYEIDPSRVPITTPAGVRQHLCDGSIVVPPATRALLN